MAVFVLVPGGYTGSWMWREVARRLWAAGHEAYTPSLTGMGERAHLAHPDVDLNTHIQDVVAEITFSELTQVILVGYSYSGMVITGVAEKIPERIAQLVYLDAWVPEDGQSAADLIGAQAVGMLLQAVQTYGEGWKLYNPDPEADPRLTPQPVKTGLVPVSLKNPLAACLPCAYIYCPLDKNGVDPNLIPMTRTAQKVKQDPAWRYFEIESDHAVVRDHPDEVVAILLQLAKI